jgi:hypothetical protein
MSTTAKKKLIILSSILLMMIIAFFLILNDNVRIKKLVHISIGINKTNDEYNAEEKNYLKQDLIEADFKDLKNDTISLPDEIIRLVSTELKDFNWNKEFQEEKLPSLYHETIFAKYFPSNRAPGRKFIILTFSNHTGNFYHAAAGRISLFELEKDSQSWHLTRHYIAFGNGNEYGLEPLGCELVRIGSNNKYAVIVHTSYSGQGHEKETKAVYTEVDNSFKFVFDFTSYEYYNDYPTDIEYTDGYSDMRILQSNKTWFDIETKSEETKWNDKTPGAVKRFVFNGEEYVEAKRNFNAVKNGSSQL